VRAHESAQAFALVFGVYLYLHRIAYGASTGNTQLGWRVAPPLSPAVPLSGVQCPLSDAEMLLSLALLIRLDGAQLGLP
jgi:hypothetical protein